MTDPMSAEIETRMAELNARNRRSAVGLVIRNVSDVDELVWLTAALELDDELDLVAGTVVERHRVIGLARARLDEAVGPRSPADE